MITQGKEISQRAASSTHGHGRHDKGHLVIGLRAIRRNATVVRAWDTTGSPASVKVWVRLGMVPKRTMGWGKTESNGPVAQLTRERTKADPRD